MTEFLVTLVAVAGAGMLLVVSWWGLVRLMYRRPILEDEIHTIRTDDDWEIKLYRRVPEEGEPGEPILFCHGAVTNRYNFQIPVGRGLVDTMLARGYDCWMIEYRGTIGARPPQGRRKHDASLDDYLTIDLPAAVDYVREYTGYTKIHWVGHSLGGMLLYAFDLVFGPDAVASGTTLGSPVGFDGAVIPQRSFVMRLASVSVRLTMEMLQMLTPFAAVVHPFPRLFPMNWDNKHPDVGGKELSISLDTMGFRAIQDLLTMAHAKCWLADAGAVDVKANLDKLRIPLFAVYGARDPFVPVSEARAFFEKLTLRDKRLLILSAENGCSADYGHVDLAFGKNGRQELYEPIAEWIAKHPLERALEAVDSTGIAVTGVEVAPDFEHDFDPEEQSKPHPRTPAKSRPRKKAATPRKSTAKKKAKAPTKSTAKKKTATKRKSSH